MVGRCITAWQRWWNGRSQPASHFWPFSKLAQNMSERGNWHGKNNGQTIWKRGGLWHKGQLTRRGRRYHFKNTIHIGRKKDILKEKKGNRFLQKEGRGKTNWESFFHKITEGKSNKARKMKKKRRTESTSNKRGTTSNTNRRRLLEVCINILGCLDQCKTIW